MNYEDWKLSQLGLGTYGTNKFYCLQCGTRFWLFDNFLENQEKFYVQHKSKCSNYKKEYFCKDFAL